METPDPTYIADNRHIAERILVRLMRPRLLRDRLSDESYEACRKSADDLRHIFESEMLAIRGGGFLLRAVMDMQKACTNFVSAAGRKSEVFKGDDDLFRHHLTILREVFAQRVTAIVETFDLQAPAEIQQIMYFRP